MEVTGERDLIRRQAESKGEEGLQTYRAQENARSIDASPGLPTGTPR